MYSLISCHRLGSSAPVLRLLDARQRTPTAPVLPVVRLFERERTCLRYVCMRDLGMKDENGVIIGGYRLTLSTAAAVLGQTNSNPRGRRGGGVPAT